uniref:Cytochrome c assembly protein domain-containing protein n=1 Tax=Solanum lycopersicum TaxID=4081 RepID=A0A3Q7EVE8_SOLLC
MVFCTSYFSWVKILSKILHFFAKNYYRSQLIQQLYYCSYLVISLGFTFFPIGILLGAVWANKAWGLS